MSHIFDPLNIVILAIAVVIFWRLGSVLGRRTGNERPPLDPYNSRDSLEKTAPRAPSEQSTAAIGEPTAGASVDTNVPGKAPPVWEGFAAKDSAVAKGLDKIVAADGQFRAEPFLEGAKTAYETIVTAFAKGDKQTLKPLLSREVFDGFAKAIDSHRQAGETLETNFVGINKAQIVNADLVGKKANIMVRFASEMISSTRNAAGDVLEGDPKKIREITDVWTFERDVQSKDPNWTLVATEATT